MNQLKVAVCVCTYRRAAQLDQLLGALAELRWAQLPVPAVTVVVVENELDGPGKEVCDKHISQGKLDIRYAAEPLPGVPVARNRCLDLAADWSDFIAFIDDDELPESDWLEQLLLQQASAKADVVAGPVLATYVVPPPDWLVRGGFHDLSPPVAPRGSFLQKLSSALIPRITDPDHRASGSPVQWFNTGNVLLRSDIVRQMGLRFDESLRQLGYGEDTLFSKQIAKAGYRMVWSNEAVTHHTIPPSRMTAGWPCSKVIARQFSTRSLGRTRPQARRSHYFG